MNEYLNGIYRESRGYDLTQFWTDVCRDRIARDLMLNPPTLEPQPSSSKKSKSSHRMQNKKSLFDRNDQQNQKSLYSKSGKNGVQQLELLLKQAESDLSKSLFNDDEENSELFACGTKTGTQESAGQRILQIATIIRNLSRKISTCSTMARLANWYHLLWVSHRLPFTLTDIMTRN